MEKWASVMKVRSDVNGVLERARADKRIGKSLEAEVRLFAEDDEAAAALREIRELNLADLFIVSDCQLAEGKPDADKVVGNGEGCRGLQIEVSAAAGVKCPRCWTHSTQAHAP